MARGPADPGASPGRGAPGPGARGFAARPPTCVAHPGAPPFPGGRAPRPSVPLPGAAGGPGHGSYLVDSASSHMLVSKIKPCMSKYKQSIR